MTATTAHTTTSTTPTTAYSDPMAEIYDLIHTARGRDWAGEADDIAALVRDRRPGARSLLDVACGTGTHLVRFAEHFDDVAGLELSEPMAAIARAKLPGRDVWTQDMRDIRPERTFDAVLCLCFSLGYMGSVADLEAAVRSLARCLNPGGVVIAEPWWFPENFLDGFVTGAVAEEPGRVVTRVSHSVREGRTSRMTVHHTVAEPDGIRDFTEHEIYSLFTREEYAAAFAAAGLSAGFRPGPPNGRGLFVAEAVA